MEKAKRIDNKSKNRVIDKPEDTFRKRGNSYLGRTVHEYLGLPGKYIGTIENEIPDGENNEKRTDGGYKVELDGKEMIISLEDESSIVNEETLAKTYGYCVNMEYAQQLPVYSVITTPIPLKKCTKVYWPSQTLKYIPRIISFNEFDGNERLQYARFKVNNNETFSDVEGYDLINTVRMFDEGNDEVLEEVCNLFSNMHIDDQFIRFELGKCLECLISKYARIVDDVYRLNEVINMTRIVGDTEQLKEELIEKGRQIGKEEGIEEGRQIGKKELARKFAEKFGIDEVAKISGLSKEQILNEDLEKIG